MSVVKVRAVDVQPGDMAHRVDGSLDARPVERVGLNDRGRRVVALRIGTVVTDPIPASWYRFTREVEES